MVPPPTQTSMVLGDVRCSLAVPVRGLPRRLLARYAAARNLRLQPATAAGPRDEAVHYEVRAGSDPTATLPAGGWPSPQRVTRRPGGCRISTPHGSVLVHSGRPARIEGPHPGNPRSARAIAELLDIALGQAAFLHGAPILHSSAWSAVGIGVLAVGASSSGKTTLALAALSLGGRIVGDDALLITVAAGRSVSLHSFRRDLRIREDTLGLVPESAREALVAIDDDNDRRWSLGASRRRALMIDGLEPDLLWLVSVDRRFRIGRVEPVDQSQALAGLIAGSAPLFLSPRFGDERRRALPVLVKLAQSCRGFRVRVGREMVRDPRACLGELLAACGT